MQSEVSIQCEVDEIYTASCQMMADAGTNADGALHLAWYDGNKGYLGEEIVGLAPTTTWTRKTVSKKMPSTAHYVGVHLWVGGNAAPAGAYHFDDVALTRSSQIIVQGDPDGPRIEITPKLLAGYSDRLLSQIHPGDVAC